MVAPLRGLYFFGGRRNRVAPVLVEIFLKKATAPIFPALVSLANGLQLDGGRMLPVNLDVARGREVQLG